jgi:aliphatic sulfonates import ATP-binding protein ssuB 3
MIRVEQLTVKFEKTVLCDVNFELTQNGVYCITGPSGIGKSTLLNAIAGLIPYSGRISADGRISYLFQEDRLLPWMNALENVRLVLKDHFERAEYYLKKFGLQEAAGKLPGELSGGMRRRCALARCFAYDGNILMLDEPFRGLDEANADIVREEIKSLAKERIVLVVTHNPEDIIKLDGADLHLFFSEISFGSGGLRDHVL